MNINSGIKFKIYAVFITLYNNHVINTNNIRSAIVAWVKRYILWSAGLQWHSEQVIISI